LQGGFSLIELLIATGIGLVSVLLISQLLVSIQSQFATLQDKIRKEVGVSEMLFYVHHYVGMALDLTLAPGDLNAAAFDGTYGAIREYSLAGWTPTTGSGPIDVIAFFLRETLSSRNGDRDSRPPAVDRFKPTGIFFQRPTVNRFGVLYLSVNLEAGEDIQPRAKDLRFEGLVDFVVRDVKFDTYTDASTPPVTRKMIHSIVFDATQRHYMPTTAPSAMVWCPPAFMTLPACATGNRAYRDVTKTFALKIRNNVIGQSLLQKVAGPPPASGAPNYQPRFRRTYENIYFLRPSYPLQALTR
jgi:hypothetical protein